MEVSEVRVALRSEVRPSDRPAKPGEQRLKAYATVTFDHCFVVRNIKIIEGRQGLFVAMPSHRAKTACSRCQFKNDIGGRFCIQCGSRMDHASDRLTMRETRESFEGLSHRDIAHPITSDFRNHLQQRILEVYEAERARTRLQVGIAV